MTIAEWCVFGTLMLALLSIAPIKWIGYRQFDNARPRDAAFYQDPLRARALGAHQNGIEAFPPLDPVEHRLRDQYRDFLRAADPWLFAGVNPHGED